MALKWFQELRTRDQVLWQKKMFPFFCLLLRKFQRFGKLCAINRDEYIIHKSQYPWATLKTKSIMDYTYCISITPSVLYLASKIQRSRTSIVTLSECNGVQSTATCLSLCRVYSDMVLTTGIQKLHWGDRPLNFCGIYLQGYGMDDLPRYLG